LPKRSAKLCAWANIKPAYPKPFRIAALLSCLIVPDGGRNSNGIRNLVDQSGSTIAKGTIDRQTQRPAASRVIIALTAPMAKLIFGCGYLGGRVARLWRAAGEEVLAVTRSELKAVQLSAEGIQPLVADVARESQLTVPQGVRTVLFAVGYDRSAGRAIHGVYVEGLRRAIEALPESVARFIYVSSTGVYGQVAGTLVDEDSPCEPTREGGKACLAAEEVLRGSRFADRAVILRLAGLYGPGRIPRARELLAGKPIDAQSNGWLNLIHVEDAARIVLLAEDRAEPPRTYVVSDGQPVVRGEYYAELARLIGAARPTFVDPPADSSVAARAASDKRIDPARMFAELRPTLTYPSYREGLAAIVSAG
jgi:nucleoside-diphosphate-sugar epimerase